MAEHIEQFSLPNGIRVVLEPMPYVKTAAFGVFVGVGSVCETKENNGISHMIEHMLFKGTEMRSAKELADITARLGDTANAYTGKEYTAYYGLTVAEELPKLMEVLADMLLHSVFEAKALSKEKGVICEEIDMYNNSPDDLVHELAQKRAWQGHPLSFQISGTKGVVRGMTREKILTFYKREYRPDKMVLSVAGAFDKKRVEVYLEELFCPGGQGTAASVKKSGLTPDQRYGKYYGDKTGAGISGSGSQGMASAKEVSDKPVQIRSAAEYTRNFSKSYQDTSQLHMNLVFPGISYLDEKRHIATVFQSVFGGSNNSLLFQKIREEEGLAYSVYSYGCPYAKEGLVHIDAVTAPNQAETVFEYALEVCDIMREQTVSEETVSTHKALIRTEAILSKESVQSRMEGNGRSVLLRGRVVSQEEELKYIEAVTVEDIREFARQVLCPEKMSVCLVGETRSAGQRLMRKFEQLG
ncbi:MAG: insulinase family protein [Lachnospiraceae bacterium]|nr:insulinase family protein [Lachnospiraceae bacterium]MBQ8845669.1 insulinase family protein [Lachnospiraceae bacterium]